MPLNEVPTQEQIVYDLMGREPDIGDCTCLYSCDEDGDGCSLSGDWHVHPQDERGVTGPCPLHPDAPGDH